MGKQWNQWQTLLSWALKSLQIVTATIKLKRLLLGRKVMTKLDSILKSRDIILPAKVHLVKAMVFPVVMYGCPTPVLLPGKSHGQRSLGLQSMGSLKVGHDWATSLSLFTFMHWRRKWQPTPVFLPGESQGRGSLVGCHLWGHTESDMTEMT